MENENSLTDEQMCEAVIDGLRGVMQFKCDHCSEIHLLAARPKRPTEFGPPCPCRDKAWGHSWARITCPCGSTFAYGPNAGWRCIGRNHSTWKEREQKLRAEIERLEQRLMDMS